MMPGRLVKNLAAFETPPPFSGPLVLTVYASRPFSHPVTSDKAFDLTLHTSEVGARFST
jgi:hypothetical protein